MGKPKNRIPPQKPTAPKAAPAKRETVVIAYVHPGMVSAYFAKSLMLTLLFDRIREQRIVNVLDDWSSANISASRNELTRQFLDDSSADWLMWIDSDMAWNPDALEQLLAVADPTDRPIVGGLAFGSLDDKLFPTIYHLASMPEGGFSTVRVFDYPRDALVRCDATGAAFLLIHRTALERIRDHGFNRTFPWFQETENAGQPVGEDITFCLRARQLGIPVHVNAAVKVGHHKSTLLTEERFMAQLLAEAEQQTAQEG